MKTTKPIYVLLFLTGLYYLNTGCCKPKQNKYVTYEGDVYNKSGQPAINVTVVLEACGGGPADKQEQCEGYRTMIKTKKTGPDGHFYIHERAAKSGIYFVTIDNTYSNSSGVSAERLTEDWFVNVHLSY